MSVNSDLGGLPSEIPENEGKGKKNWKMLYTDWWCGVVQEGSTSTTVTSIASVKYHEDALHRLVVWCGGVVPADV
jgi:hypothetical protein